MSLKMNSNLSSPSRSRISFTDLISTPSPRRRKVRIRFDPSHVFSPTKSKKRIDDIRRNKIATFESLSRLKSSNETLILSQDNCLKDLRSTVHRQNDSIHELHNCASHSII